MDGKYGAGLATLFERGSRRCDVPAQAPAPDTDAVVELAIPMTADMSSRHGCDCVASNWGALTRCES